MVDQRKKLRNNVFKIYHFEPRFKLYDVIQTFGNQKPKVHYNVLIKLTANKLALLSKSLYQSVWNQCDLVILIIHWA